MNLDRILKKAIPSLLACLILVSCAKKTEDTEKTESDEDEVIIID